MNDGERIELPTWLQERIDDAVAESRAVSDELAERMGGSPEMIVGKRGSVFGLYITRRTPAEVVQAIITDGMRKEHELYLEEVEMPNMLYAGL